MKRASHLYRLIIGYRWISLLPPLLALVVQQQSILLWLVAAVMTLGASLCFEPIKRWLYDYPALLLLDLLLIMLLVYLSGGWQSPYYLFATSPLLVSAFLLKRRDTVLMTAVLFLLYSLIVLSGATINGIIVITQLVGFILLAGSFGYVATLLNQLEEYDEQRAMEQKDLTHTAIERERLRIARDMHDTISQSLFGLVFALNGCQKLLADQPDLVAKELRELEQIAQTARSELRHVIFDLWPDELTSEGLSADLHRYFNNLAERPIELELDINGEFAPLTPYVRRTLYRICQESLANIVHHSSADHARVCLDIANGRVRLLVRDNGIGFNPATAYDDKPTEHFGLRGMAERAQTLGGTFDLFSRPNEGTSIVVDIPIV